MTKTRVISESTQNTDARIEYLGCIFRLTKFTAKQLNPLTCLKQVSTWLKINAPKNAQLADAQASAATLIDMCGVGLLVPTLTDKP